MPGLLPQYLLRPLTFSVRVRLIPDLMRQYSLCIKQCRGEGHPVAVKSVFTTYLQNTEDNHFFIQNGEGGGSGGSLPVPVSRSSQGLRDDQPQLLHKAM